MKTDGHALFLQLRVFDDLDMARSTEATRVRGGEVTLDKATLLTVTALAEQQHVPVLEMVVELIQDGITARATRRVANHRCQRGEINKRHCRICSRPMP